MTQPPTIRVLITEPGSMTVRDTTMRFGLAEVQKLVGGYIEHVTLTGEGVTLYCDEESRLKDKPQNRLASVLYWMGHGLQPNDVYDIRGVAVICGRPNGEDWDTDVPSAVAATLAAIPGVTVVRE